MEDNWPSAEKYTVDDLLKGVCDILYDDSHLEREIITEGSSDLGDTEKC